MKRNARGAAQVNVLWLVFTIVLLFASLGLFADGLRRAGELERQVIDARAQADRWKASDEDLRNKLVRLSGVVGFNDPGRAGSHPEAEVASTSLENLKNTFATIGPEVKTVQGALPRVIEAYNGANQKIAEIEGSVRRLETELKESRAGVAAVSRQKQEEIDKLRRDVQDANANAASAQAASEQQVQRLRAENRDLETQAREARAALETREEEARREVAGLQARNQELSKKLAFTKEPDRPDGRVLSVSEKTGLAFVDLGAKHRVRRGMRFTVLDPSRPESPPKGVVEVTAVERDMSETRVVDLADRFRPVSAGDLVANPLFDPNGERNAVLLGEFRGRYKKPDLAVFLAEVGIRVQERVDVTTDYLILGSEKPEAAIEGRSLLREEEEYKRAEAMGVQIVALREVESFFRF